METILTLEYKRLQIDYFLKKTIFICNINFIGVSIMKFKLEKNGFFFCIIYKLIIFVIHCTTFKEDYQDQTNEMKLIRHEPHREKTGVLPMRKHG